MAKTVTVRWELTEEHEYTTEVDDDFNTEEIDSSWLAEVEGNETYSFTMGRDVLEVEVNDG